MASKVLKNRLVKNIFSLGIVQIANYAIPLIAIPIVSRIIGPEKFGVINFVTAFVAYFTLLIGYGFNLTATRRLAADPGNEEKRNQVFNEVLVTQGILFGISIVVFLICLYFIPQLRNEWIVSLFSFMVCFSTFLTQDWLFQAMQDLSKVALLNITSKTIFILLIIFVVRHQSDYIWYAFALSISQVFVSVLSFVWSIRRYNLKFQRIKLRACFSLLYDEKMYFFSVVVINLYTTTNIVLLGFLTDASQVGYYTAGQKISAIIIAILNLPIRQALFPYMSKSFAVDREKSFDIAQRFSAIVFWLCFLVGLFTILLSKYIIIYLYGDRFMPAVIILQILAFIPVIISINNIWGISLMMNLNLDKVYFKITLISAIASIILNLILVHYIGYVGSAISWLVTEFLTVLSIFYYLTKEKVKLINLAYLNPFKLINSLLSVKSKL